MSFTQPCFIQLQHNVDIFFVIDKLDMLGYKRSINQYGLQEGSESTYIICKSDGSYYFAYSISYYTNDWGINCIDNIELFTALAALRDDSDYMQWFVNKNGYFEMCFNDKVENYLCGNGVRKYRQIDETYHKATVEEIIEHFK